METETVDTESSRVAEEAPLVPTVIAKKREPLPEAAGQPDKDERNAAEIARLSAWATGDCGKPILPD